jgi:adenine-specific DNA-methyltransferase
MELRTYNIEYLTCIESAQTKEELHRVYVDMANNAFLQFWFDRKNWEKDEKYTTLPLEEQKVKLRELLDMNQLYLNAGDMYDTQHSVSPLDQSLTAKFYGKKD